MKRFVLLSWSILLAATLILPALAQEQERWDLLTVKELGVDQFLAEHPDWNGSKVVIAVLDTGVDMGVAGLDKLPDGGVKVVDVRDFTGEGDLFWEEAQLVPDGKGE